MLGMNQDEIYTTTLQVVIETFGSEHVTENDGDILIDTGASKLTLKFDADLPYFA